MSKNRRATKGPPKRKTVPMTAELAVFAQWYGAMHPDPFLIYSPLFARLMGTAHGGLILARILSWCVPAPNGTTKLRAERDGELWYVCTHEEMAYYTGATVNQVKRAIDKDHRPDFLLVTHGLFDAQRRTFYRLDWDRFVPAFRAAQQAMRAEREAAVGPNRTDPGAQIAPTHNNHSLQPLNVGEEFAHFGERRDTAESGVRAAFGHVPDLGDAAAARTAERARPPRFAVENPPSTNRSAENGRGGMGMGMNQGSPTRTDRNDPVPERPTSDRGSVPLAEPAPRLPAIAEDDPTVTDADPFPAEYHFLDDHRVPDPDDPIWRRDPSVSRDIARDMEDMGEVDLDPEFEEHDRRRFQEYEEEEQGSRWWDGVLPEEIDDDEIRGHPCSRPVATSVPASGADPLTAALLRVQAVVTDAFFAELDAARQKRNCKDAEEAATSLRKARQKAVNRACRLALGEGGGEAEIHSSVLRRALEGLTAKLRLARAQQSTDDADVQDPERVAAARAYLRDRDEALVAGRAMIAASVLAAGRTDEWSPYEDLFRQLCASSVTEIVDLATGHVLPADLEHQLIPLSPDVALQRLVDALRVHLSRRVTRDSLVHHVAGMAGLRADGGDEAYDALFRLVNHIRRFGEDDRGVWHAGPFVEALAEAAPAEDPLATFLATLAAWEPEVRQYVWWAAYQQNPPPFPAPILDALRTALIRCDHSGPRSN